MIDTEGANRAYNIFLIHKTGLYVTYNFVY